MQKRMVWMILFFLMWASVPQSFAESETLLPSVDLEFIIARLAHTESLLKSGRGKFKLYMASYFSRSKLYKEITVKQAEKGRRRTFSTVEELEFAFSKTYSYFNSDGSKFVADGNIQLVISPQGRNSQCLLQPVSSGGLSSRRVGSERLGILSWYRRQRLSDYLRSEKCPDHWGLWIVSSTKCKG